mgnify:CR=1 FL=1
MVLSDPYYPRCTVVLNVLMEDYGTGVAQSYEIQAIPREVEILRNDHRTADTCKITLDLRDWPFDPRTFRSCRVTVCVGDVLFPTGALVLSDAQFVGFVDTPESKRSDSGDTVTLECRDYTSVFLDQRWDGSAIDISQPLQTVVDSIVAMVAGADALTVGYSLGASTTVLALAVGRAKFVPRQGDDVWTVLVDLCGRVGLIPVFQLDLLLILTPDDFGADRTAFYATTLIVPQTAAFVFGENLSSLSYRRKFREARSMQVEVRAYDETKRLAQSALYPPLPIAVKQSVSTAGVVKTTVAPILPWFVSGTYTAPDLLAIAEKIWKEAARQEIEIDIETEHMRDSGGLSCVRIGNGTRVTITMATTITSDIAGMSPGEAIAKLVSSDRPLALDVATAFVASITSANVLIVQFYVARATHQWSRERGYSCAITAINYVGGAA